MPLTLGELGVREADIKKLVEHAKMGGALSLGNFVSLDEGDVTAILRLAL